MMRDFHTPAHANRAHRNDRRGTLLRLRALAVVHKGRGATLVPLRRPVVVGLRVLRRPPMIAA